MHKAELLAHLCDWLIQLSGVGLKAGCFEDHVLPINCLLEQVLAAEIR